MKTTRMRMTKEAARIIHEYRDGRGHKSNSDAVHGLISDLDAANCNKVFMSKQIAELEAESERLKHSKACLQSNLAMKLEKLDQKDAHIKRINAELSRGRYLCDELQKYVRRLKKENYSLAEEIYNKPSSKPSLLWRILAFIGCWSPLFIYAAFEAGSKYQ